MGEAVASEYGTISGGDAGKGPGDVVRGMVDKARDAMSASFPGETRTGLSQGTVAALAYAGWIIGGLFVYFFEENNPYAHFHAAQSIVVWVTLWVAVTVCHFASILTFGLFGLWKLLTTVLGLGTVVVWIYLSFKAYRGGPSNDVYKVPYLSYFADKLAS